MLKSYVLAGALIATLSGAALAEQTMNRMGAATGRSAFLTTLPQNALLVSNIHEQNVYDPQENKIGEVKDLMLDRSGKVTAAIISVGGFLGIGEKDVAVAFDALQAAKARGVDVLIADTAGRLHTQQGLMAELGKIRRVLGKLDPDAPHEVLMVIDGTTGQNAISQLRQFNEAVKVTGLVVTKLDGTAKGGVVFALAREFGIPIRYAGIGERPEDLRVFDAEAFVDALLPESLGT